MLNSRKLGVLTEEKAKEIFFNKGYWVYQCPSNIKGQPADLIIAKDNKITLVEVKHCKNNRFTLNRIEENQLSTYKYFKTKGNTNHKILVKFKDGIYLIDFYHIYSCINQGYKSLTVDTFEELGERLDE